MTEWQAVSSKGGGVAAAPSRERAQRLLLAAAFLALALGAAVPVLSVKVPAMTDFVNHLGRMYVIAHLGDDPDLARYYAVRWTILPNLAMDAIVPALARAIGIFAAGKAFVLLTMLLMVTGVQALHGALHRRWSVWPLAAFVFLYNWIFFLGFVNYLFCIGLALWGTAAWIALRERRAWLRGAVSLAFVLMIFFSHFQGLEIYGLPLLCYEMWRLRTLGRPPWRRAVPDLLAFGLPFAAALALARLSPTTGFASETFYDIPGKLIGLWWAIKTYDTPVDLAVAVLCVGFLAWALAGRTLRLHPVAFYMLVASAVAFVVTPWQLMSASFVDTRLPVAFVFILMGMASWHADWRGTLGFCSVLLVLCFIRFGLVEVAWRDLAGIMADYERSMAEIPRGSRVLVTCRFDSPIGRTLKVALSHFPALVMIERSSMESHAFTHPAKQVLVLKPPYRASAGYDARPLDLGYIDPAYRVTVPTPDDDYWSRWTETYDFVYVLYATPESGVRLHGADLLYQGGTFQLYRVRHPAPSALGR